MPTFAYKALGRDGKTVAAREYAENRKALETGLKRRALVLQDCREVRTAKIPFRVTLALVGQMSQLVGSGITIDRALQIIAEDAQSKQLADLAARLRQGVKRGQPISQALMEVGRFDPLLAPLLRAGEASGRMPEILGTLERHYEQRQKMMRTIIGNMAYPAVLVFANVLSIVGLGIYVIPVFKTLFEDRMDSLAASTRAVFWISDFLIADGTYLLAGLIAVVAAVVMAFRASEGLRVSFDRLLLRMPLFGTLIGKIQAVNVMAVLGVMLTSGVPLMVALELACEAASNRPIRKALGEVLKELRRGRRFCQVLALVPGFPKTVNRFVTVGEETGNLGDMCSKAAHNIQEETDVQIKSMVTLLEPVLILLMGGMVAFVVVSMLLAVYSISDLK